MKKNKRRAASVSSPEQMSFGGTMCFYSAEFEHVQLNTASLQSSQPYQRRVRSKRVKQIVDNFNPLYLDEIIVSERDGKYWVVDGQNRIAAFREMNGGSHCLVMCKVYSGLTYEDEAKMFYHLDKIRGQLKFNEVIQARREADDPEIKNIVRIMSQHGITWTLTGGGSAKDKTITSSKAVIECYEKYGPDILNRGIELLMKAWGGSRQSLAAPFVKGVCLFVSTYGTKIKTEIFASKLGSVTPNEIVAMARQDITAERQDLRYARIFQMKYNLRAGAANRLEYKYSA